MLHIYKDAITGKIYQVYDDELPDDEPEDEEDKEAEEDDDCSRRFQTEYDHYLNWLYQ